MKKKKLTLTRRTITALSGVQLRAVAGADGGGEGPITHNDQTTCAGWHSYRDPQTLVVLCGIFTEATCQVPTGGAGLP